jgi:hypothetical protein
LFREEQQHTATKARQLDEQAEQIEQLTTSNKRLNNAKAAIEQRQSMNHS